MRRTPPIAGLSLKERIAQLLIIGFEGTSLSDAAKRRLARGAGGVVLFRRNCRSPEQIHKLCREIAAHTSVGEPLIGIDQEPGLVTRLGEPFTAWPGAAAIARSGEPALAEQTGRAIARELRAVGINTDWAPVCDVHSNPANPIIGPRAFGADPGEVARFARAFIAGMQREGVAACAKHFPGHGDTETDSHLELPVVRRSRTGLYRTELPPFQAAFHEGVAMVMTAHVLYPDIDPARPATLSPVILTDLLRARLGFNGVVVSDDLGMKGIAQGRTPEEIAAQTIAAGCDLLLAGQDLAGQERLVDGVARAVKCGRIPEVRINESVERVWAMKERFGFEVPERIERLAIGSAVHRSLSERLFAFAGEDDRLGGTRLAQVTETGGKIRPA